MVFGVSLRLRSGVPVVDVRGVWVPNVATAMVEVVCGLLAAGHYEIIVNVQRAATLGASAVHTLLPLAQAVRDHHGHLDIVGTAEQVEHLSGRVARSVVRLATSEAQAISRIKGVPIAVTSGTFHTAKLQMMHSSH